MIIQILVLFLAFLGGWIIPDAMSCYKSGNKVGFAANVFLSVLAVTFAFLGSGRL